MIRFLPIPRLLFCAFANGYAEDYFVAPSGRDTNDGSRAAPFRTIQKAVNGMTAGDTCHIRAGRYLECHLNCLDSQGEWFYEPESKALYLWARGGAMPEDVRGQTLTHGIEARNVSHVVVSGISFFACTFAFDDADHCTIDDCPFNHYEHTKRMLGVQDQGLHDQFTCETRMQGPRTGSFNTITNCIFAYCDGGALQVAGKFDRFVKVLGHDLDWSGVGYDGPCFA